MADKDTQTTERYEVRLVCIDEGGKESVIESREVPKDKLEQQVAQLPDREAMSLVNANVFAPINLAAALNVLSDNSVAMANAQQWAPTQQTI
jgi:cation transport regulator ChaC